MRKGKAPKRKIAPDFIYKDSKVSKFINYLTREGKKEKARKIFSKTLQLIQEKTKKIGLETWKEAIEKVRPLVEIKSRRMRGTSIQLPVQVRPERSTFISMNWIIKFARKRREKSMEERLAAEIIAASQGEGSSFKRKVDTHKIAESNKVFSHLSR